MHNFLVRIRCSTTTITIFALAIFLLIALLAITFNYYRIDNNFKKQIISDSLLVINKTNAIFDEYNKALELAIATTNEPCEQQEYTLKKIVGSNDWISSLTVLRKGLIFCSSFFEVNQISSAVIKSYTEKKLNLLDSKFLIPTRPIISYSIQQGDWGGFITTPVSIFLKELQFSKFPKETFIVINDSWLNIDTQTYSNKEEISKQWLVYSSYRYPFKILVDYPKIKENNKEALSFIELAIGLLILLVISFFYITITTPKRNFKKAIQKNELIPYYQLIISTVDNSWQGVEVLARWQHPTKGLITPNHFISIAERTNLIIPMTRMLMAKVAAELTDHIHNLPKPFNVSFNIHSSHLQNPSLLNDCKVFLDSFPPNLIRLGLELVESQFIESSNSLESLLKTFREIGVTIAIDDFGTGYSNLGYLQKYEIDHLKIDRMFIAEICQTQSNNYLVDTIIDLAKNMEMDIIAEGVETIDQLHYLKNQGVKYIQGFLFSRPSPINEMIKLLLKPIHIPVIVPILS